MKSKTIIGENIYQLRISRGWTQAQLSEAVGLTKSAILGIESGRNLPRRANIQKLAEVLEVPVADLQNGLLKPEWASLGHEIRAARRAKGWTQEELGRQLGIKAAAIFAYERRAVIPAPALLHGLELVLDVLLDAPPQPERKTKRMTGRKPGGGIDAPPQLERKTKRMPGGKPGGGINALLKPLGWTRGGLAAVLDVNWQELTQFAGVAGTDTREKFEAWAGAMEVSSEKRVSNRRTAGAITPGNEIGALIYQLRTARAISQKGLAELAELSPSYICNIEVGSSKPGPAARKKLALLLGVEEEQLGTTPGRRVKPTPLTLGQAIRVARQAQGWSQIELGLKVGEKGLAISWYELDKTVPTRGRLAQLARLLKVPLEAPPQPEKTNFSRRKAATAPREKDKAVRQEAKGKQRDDAAKRAGKDTKRDETSAKRKLEAARRATEVALQKAEAANRRAEVANRRAEAALQNEAWLKASGGSEDSTAPGWTLLGQGVGSWRQDNGWTLGRAIFAARHLRGWSQTVLAKNVGVSGATISKYETNKLIPAKDELDQLARVLKVRFVKPRQRVEHADIEQKASSTS